MSWREGEEGGGYSLVDGEREQVEPDGESAAHELGESFVDES
jgi:hypothetical protein